MPAPDHTSLLFNEHLARTVFTHEESPLNETRFVASPSFGPVRQIDTNKAEPDILSDLCGTLRGNVWASGKKPELVSLR